jgi:DNA-binding YbaB/EbfC family protein
VSGEESPQVDLGSLLSQLGQVQQNLQEAQEAAAAQVVEGTAGGGAVRIKATGGLDFQEVLIYRSQVDTEDMELLQDLILAAIRDAVEKASALTSDALGGLGGGVDLGGLGGLFGQ